MAHIKRATLQTRLQLRPLFWTIMVCVFVFHCRRVCNGGQYLDQFGLCSVSRCRHVCNGSFVGINSGVMFVSHCIRVWNGMIMPHQTLSIFWSCLVWHWYPIAYASAMAYTYHTKHYPNMDPIADASAMNANAIPSIVNTWAIPGVVPALYSHTRHRLYMWSHKPTRKHATQQFNICIEHWMSNG